MEVATQDLVSTSSDQIRSDLTNQTTAFIADVGNQITTSVVDVTNSATMSIAGLTNQTTTSINSVINHTTRSSFFLQNASELNKIILNSQMAEKLLPVTTFIYVLMVFGLLGNSVVVYVYLLKWKSTTIKYFIGYLATLDLITSGLCMPLEIVFHTNPVLTNIGALCRVLRFSRALTLIAEAFWLVVIAFDRYLRVCKYKKKQISVTAAKRLCIASIPISMCFSWPSLFVFGSYDRENDIVIETSCGTVQHLRETFYPILYYGLLFLLFIIVSVCLFVLYILVGVKLYCLRTKQNLSIPNETFKQAKTGNIPADTVTDDSRSNTLDRDRRKQDRHHRHAAIRKSSFVDLTKLSVNMKHMRRRSTRIMKRQKVSLTLFLITGLEFVSFLPYVVIMVCKGAIPHFLENLSESQQIWYNLGLVSYFLGNAFNPFIYGFFSRNFRRKCLEILHSVKNRKNDNTLSSGADRKVSTSK